MAAHPDKDHGAVAGDLIQVFFGRQRFGDEAFIIPAPADNPLPVRVVLGKLLAQSDHFTDGADGRKVCAHHSQSPVEQVHVAVVEARNHRLAFEVYPLGFTGCQWQKFIKLADSQNPIPCQGHCLCRR